MSELLNDVRAENRDDPDAIRTAELILLELQLGDERPSKERQELFAGLYKLPQIIVHSVGMGY